MAFWLVFFLFVGSTVLSALLQKRPKDAQPNSLGDFQVPTAEEGRTIPVIAGTVKMAAPNVVWYGDLDIQPIKKAAGGFLGIGAKGVIVGYRYYVGIMMALCAGPIDAIVAISAQDKDVPFTSSTVTGPDGEDYRKLTINQEDLFGGNEKEGGLSGTIDLYRGLSTHRSNAYLSAHMVDPAPAYNGLCYAVAEHFYVGTSQYVKNMAFVLRRCPDPLAQGAAVANLNGDANPALFIYELLTSAWGLGEPSGKVNMASFQAVAVTLANEGTGISMQLDDAADADSIIGDILRHIDGALYTDPATGLWTLVLARADYDPNAIMVLGEDDLLEAPKLTRASWEETLNEVKVSFIDRATFKEAVAQAQDITNFTTQGELATVTIPMKGFSNMDVAMRAAMRELKTHSYPAMTGSLIAKRKAWSQRIAGVFKLNWAPLGISGMVMRITKIDYGSLEEGAIRIDMVEDIFNVAYTAYASPGPSEWQDPLAAPAAPAAQLLQEVPYHLAQELDDEQIFYVNGSGPDLGERRALIAAVRGDGTSRYFEVWSDEGGGYAFTNKVDSFCPSGVLAANYGRNTAATDLTGFTVQTGRDLTRLVSTDASGLLKGTNLAVIGNEWVSWQTVTDNGDGTFTISGVMRGVMDTLPADHLAGDRIWFISDGAGLVRPDAYDADLTLAVKSLPVNGKGKVALGSVTAVNLTTASRALKPLPPGKVQINGVYWPNGGNVTGDAVLTWAHRNKISQRSSQLLVAQDDAGSAVQEGTYTVEVLVNGIVKQTVTGLTGSSYTYTAVQRAADDPDPAHLVQFRITPVNNGLNGTVRTTDTFLMV